MLGVRFSYYIAYCDVQAIFSYNAYGRGDGCNGADQTLASVNLTNVISHETWSRSGCLLWPCQLRGPANAKGAPGATDIPSAARFSLVSRMAASTKVPAES